MIAFPLSAFSGLLAYVRKCLVLAVPTATESHTLSGLVAFRGCHTISTKSHLSYYAEMLHLNTHLRFGHDSFHLKRRKKGGRFLNDLRWRSPTLLSCPGSVFSRAGGLCGWCCAWNLSLCPISCLVGREQLSSVLSCSENSALSLAPWEFTHSALQENIWHFMMILKHKLARNWRN